MICTIGKSILSHFEIAEILGDTTTSFAYAALIVSHAEICNDIARSAYEFAEAMMEERENYVG